MEQDNLSVKLKAQRILKSEIIHRFPKIREGVNGWTFEDLQQAWDLYIEHPNLTHLDASRRAYLFSLYANIRDDKPKPEPKISHSFLSRG
jgi:hypothetical protein